MTRGTYARVCSTEEHAEHIDLGREHDNHRDLACGDVPRAQRLGEHVGPVQPRIEHDRKVGDEDRGAADREAGADGDAGEPGELGEHGGPVGHVGGEVARCAAGAACAGGVGAQEVGLRGGGAAAGEDGVRGGAVAGDVHVLLGVGEPFCRGRSGAGRR